MPRYCFNIDNGELVRDETGIEFTDLNAVRRAATQILPEIAVYKACRADQHTFTVIVRDAEHQPVFTTTMNLAGFWLVER